MFDLSQQLQAALADRYTLERELGRGGMAVVYLARDLKHDRLVALKVLRPELAASIGAERFLREIQIAAKLSHPSILTLIESGEADGQLYYVMPYIEGESLRDRLNREPQLPIEDAVSISREVAEALDHAHAQGVVHRDIKPENIMFQAGHAVVTDFGIARAVTAAGGEQLTETGIAVGTPAYMSPEQAGGSGRIDGRSDLYALGCVVYEMLGGEPPFTGPSAQAILARHAVDPVPNLATLRATVPPAMVRGIEQALHKSPADRYATAAAFAEELGMAATTPLKPGRMRRARPVLLVVGAGTILLLAAGGVWRSIRSPSTEPTGPTILPTRVAFFPFVVRAGPDLTGLDEGLMDLLSAALDGAGEIRRVDPFALTSQLAREGMTTVGPDSARQIAAQFGAGHYVLARVADLGGRLRLTASVYNVDQTEPVHSSDVEAALETLSDDVRRMATELISSLPAGEGMRFDDVQTIRAASFDALKSYLEGEALWRRGWPDSALGPLRRAVEMDSTFALAWYRLSLACGFTACGSGAQAQLADRAWHFRDRLLLRDSLLVEINHAFLHGDGIRGEQLALQVTRQYPDHIEAWHFLGRNRMFYSWQLGQPLAEAWEPLRLALDLEPDHPYVAWHALNVAVGTRRLEDAATLLSLVPREGPVASWLPSLEAHLAYLQGDGQALERHLLRLRSEGAFLAIYAGWLAATNDSLETSKSFLTLLTDEARSEPTRAAGHLYLAHLAAAQGRWRAAQDELATASQWAPTLATVHRAWLAAMPFLGIPDAEVAAFRDALLEWHVPDTIPTPFPTSLLRMPNELGPHVKPYLLGLLSARLGETQRANAFAVQLETASHPADAIALRRDLAIEIRAMAAHRAGQNEEALAELEGLSLRVSDWSDPPFARRAFGRFLRAELLAELGRGDEALGWHGAWVHFVRTEFLWKAPAALRMGEVLEAQGEFEKAVEQYQRFVARWRNADPHLQPRVEEARRRIASLTR
jgi:serine/threonine protein kinase/tetratricopeptide (TPR) repeat protein